MKSNPTSSDTKTPGDASAHHVTIGKKTAVGGAGALAGAIVGGPIGADVGGAIGAAVGAAAERNPAGETSEAIDATIESVREVAGSTESAVKSLAAKTCAAVKGAAEGARREFRAAK